MIMSTLTIAPATTADDLVAIRVLFREYAASIEVDLGYQGFEEELAGLPGKYAPPKGTLLIARRGDEALGCVALRPLDNGGNCEMKRLYLRPAARGTGAGRALVERIVTEAMVRGYREMVLDALPSFAAAQALYRRVGFVDMPPYYDTPIAGTVFMRLALGSDAA